MQSKSESKKIKLESLEETAGFAKSLVSCLRPGDSLGLVGDLGAGKTALVKFLLAEFGVTELVNSPTFVLSNEYLAKDLSFEALGSLSSK